MGAALLLMPAIAHAQFSSPGYDFLKAVRERDGTKAQEALGKPGNALVETRADNGETALHIVTKRKDLLWLRFMLGQGANMNAQDSQGNTALLDAAQIGFSDGVSQLVQVGASVDLPNNRGETPLIVATEAHDLDSVRLLIQAGANPKIQDHVAGMSAMDYASRDGRSAAILKVLQEAKPVVKKNVAGPSL